jgi:hypothetical protein
MTRRKHDRYQQPDDNENIEKPQSSSSEATPNRNKRINKFVVLAAAGTILVILIVGFLVIASHANPIPQNVIQSVSFPVYHPTSEPTGYKLQISSVTSNNGSVFYNLIDSQTKQSIQVSQERLPAAFNPQVMFSHNPLPTTISPLGTVYDLSFQNQSRFMIMAPKSLVFVSAKPKISDAQLQQLIDGLKI